MAIRKSNILGKLSGRLADTTTRIRYGKEVIYALPDKVKVSKSPAAKSARKKFGLTVNFAKFVNSIPDLSAVWKAAKIPGVNSYQRLIKHNAKLTGETSLSINNIITPPGKLPRPLNGSCEDGNITIGIDSKLQSRLPVILHSVLYFYGPAENNLEDFCLEYIRRAINDFEGNDTAVSLELNEPQKLLFKKYNRCMLYSGLTSSKEKIEWSSTLSFTIK
jgi:hypothetical protein